MIASSSPSHEPRMSGRRRWILIGLAGFGAFLAMGVPMLTMMIYMGQMNGHMGQMVTAVERMAGDVAVMKTEFVGVGNYLNSININVTSMDDNMDDIEASIIAMDDNIYTINSAIQIIQASMADDLSDMRHQVTGLNASVNHMAGNVTGMNAQMGQMTRDISHGTNTFTSPWNFMRNTMPW